MITSWTLPIFMEIAPTWSNPYTGVTEILPTVLVT